MKNLKTVRLIILDIPAITNGLNYITCNWDGKISAAGKGTYVILFYGTLSTA